MKRFALGAVLLAVLITVASAASAALSTVDFNRTVNAGKVLSDIDQNVAVKFTDTSGYTGFMTEGNDGSVSFDLNRAIRGTSTIDSGFNTDATYTLGKASDGLFTITNNSDVAITVTLDNATNSNKLIMVPVTNKSATIPVGEDSEFYFTLDTHGLDKNTTLSATLKVAAAAQQ